MTHQIIFDRSVDRCSMQLGNDKKKGEVRIGTVLVAVPITLFMNRRQVTSTINTNLSSSPAGL